MRIEMDLDDGMATMMMLMLTAATTTTTVVVAVAAALAQLARAVPLLVS